MLQASKTSEALGAIPDGSTDLVYPTFTGSRKKAGTRSIFEPLSDDAEPPLLESRWATAVAVGTGGRNLFLPRLWKETIVRQSVRITDSTRFALCTLGLTVYALFGDDFRIAATHKDMDILFDLITCLCISVFILEICATSIARKDYICSFFFWLDVLPTGTLILDLTFIADLLFCSNMDGGSALKTGRAGRAGARASRTVRIVRLIRLVKVYKIYMSAMEQREKLRNVPAEAKSVGAPPVRSTSSKYIARGSRVSPGDWVEGDDSEPDLEAEDDAVQEKKSSDDVADHELRVGKKLSEMTTRRVIVLVLVMLFGMPQFNTGSHGYEELKLSPRYGIESVFDKWRTWCPFNKTHQELPSCMRPDVVLDDSGGVNFEDLTKHSEARYWYERYLLSYIYTHHDPAHFAWKLVWAGLKSKNLPGALKSHGTSDPERQAVSIVSRLGQLSQKALLANHALPADEWDATFASEDFVQALAKLPQRVKQRLVSPWSEQCLKFLGVSLSGDVDKSPVGSASSVGSLAPSEDVEVSSCSLHQELRCLEMEVYATTAVSDKQADDIQLLFVFDKRGALRVEAGLSMLQTVFICIAVGLGALAFQSDANGLLLKPIERMMTKLEAIMDNPMEAMRLGDAEFKRKGNEVAEQRAQLAKASQFRRCWYYFKKKQEKQEPMETAILEKTIIKLGGLLSLCFGEEGGDIIGHYIKRGSVAHGHAGIDVLVPGHKVAAVFCYCQMHRLDHVAHNLLEKTLQYVNEVAEIVHLIADEYSGAANRNLGDSFLLDWIYKDGREGHTEEDDALMKQKKHDMALIACAKIIATIKKSVELGTYQDDNRLVEAVGDRFQVEVGFGLHSGWAIEGAVGSDFKIDASYISPNVKIAECLQAATSHFTTPIITSDGFCSSCSPAMSAQCRLIDQVTLGSFRKPFHLFTLDLDLDGDCDRDSLALPKNRNKKHRHKRRQMREINKSKKLCPSYHPCEQLQDSDIAPMREPFTLEFFKRYFTAYRNYEAGEWMAARDMFLTCHYSPKYHTPPVLATEEDWPEDGPTKCLLRFMAGFDFEAPPDWPGYRSIRGV